jgi:hypothetical protein
MPAPWDIFWMFLPSLLLAVSFVILMACVYYIAHEEKRIYALVGLSFAIIYCVLVSMVYFVELMMVIPAIFKGTQDQLTLLIPGPDSFMITVDALGYGFMSISTLFAFAIFSGGKLERWIRGAMLANGVLTPAIIFALIYPALMAIGALWMITLPLSVVLLAIYFKRME